MSANTSLLPPSPSSDICIWCLFPADQATAFWKPAHYKCHYPRRLCPCASTLQLSTNSLGANHHWAGWGTCLFLQTPETWHDQNRVLGRQKAIWVWMTHLLVLCTSLRHLPLGDLNSTGWDARSQGPVLTRPLSSSLATCACVTVSIQSLSPPQGGSPHPACSGRSLAIIQAFSELSEFARN